MAFTPPYYGFKDSFSVREQSEVQALLDHTDTVPGLMDIYQFAQGSVSYLASVISGETTYTAFWTAMVGDAMTIASIGAPADPDAPTLAEQRVINGMLTQFYALWPADKRRVLDEVILYVGEKVENTTDPYRILLGFAGASMTGLGSRFFSRLAEYYILRAQEYLRRSSTTYDFLGQVDDQPSTHGPVRVTCVDENTGLDVISLGSATTNKAGFFRIRFSVLEGISGATYELKFTFAHAHLVTPVTVTADYVVASPNVAVPFTLEFVPPSSTSKTIMDTEIDIPELVQDYLTLNDITISRLEDIRRLGGFINISSDTIDKEDPDLLRLDSLAALEVLQDDISKNKELYTREYRSIAQIASAPRTRFVETNADLFGDLGAARIHYQARATHLYGVNNAAAALAPIPDHELGKARVTEATASGCNCPDCRSAVSPLAYLTDLLGFTMAHLSDGVGSSREFLTMEFLETTFHQRLAELRVSCDALNSVLCQNRIAAEVLRSYLLENEPGTPQQDALEAAEKEYLKQAYELLLIKLGTTYTELRNTRNPQNAPARERLLERLRIPEVHNAENTLDTLFIDLSDLDNIAEGESAGGTKGLETLFGLRDTNRDPLDEDIVGNVEQWRKAQLRAGWLREDALQHVFLGDDTIRAVIIDPDVVTVDDLRTPLESDPAFDIWYARRTWLDDEWRDLDDLTTPEDPEDPVYFISVPRVDAFKDGRIVVAYDVELATATTLTYTPQVGAPIVFSIEDQFVANGHTYFRVGGDVPENMTLGTITTDVLSPATHTNVELNIRSTTGMIERLRDRAFVGYPGMPGSGPWSESSESTSAEFVDVIRGHLVGVSMGNEAALGAVEALFLDMAGARRLVELFDKNEADPGNVEVEGNLSAEEWAEFKNILIQVLKRWLSQASGVWITEEASQSLLSPERFMPAIVQPRPSAFPYVETERPFIDPEADSRAVLPEVTSRRRQPIDPPLINALTFFEDRLTDLLSDREDLIVEGTFADRLNWAFAEPSLVWNSDPVENGYIELLNQLADPNTKPFAELYLGLRLAVSEADLRTVVSYGVKEDAGSFTIGEQEKAFAILLKSHKRLVRYAATGTGSWFGSEADIPFWKLRKSNIPQWRGTPEQRTAWLDALARNSEPPIIDGDLISPVDLREPVPTDRAYALWQARADESADWITDLEVASGGALSNVGEFNTLVKGQLGFVEDSLAVIRLQAEEGIDIRPRLAQLLLTATEFNQLLVFYDLLDGSTALLTEEKVAVRHILVQVKKRRRALTYRLEECDPESPHEPVTLSQDHFVLRAGGTTTYPPTDINPLKPWLASSVDRQAWLRKLRARLDDEKSVVDAWREALFEVDDAMMVHLRDALVRAAGDSDQDLITNARALGDQLLIELENNCCFKTNRVAAAVETIQQLVWKSRTGDLQANYPEIRFNGPGFDEAWTWMGSYANWRSAMFVFLYPENVLHPSLRQGGTAAFQSVVGATRNNRRFGPSDACEVAHEYEEYLKDLGCLEVACGQQARAYDGPEQCGAQRNSPRTLTFLFAKAPRSKRLYLTLADTTLETGTEQRGSWNVIPTPEEVDYTIHGCHRYINDEQGIDHIYLFVTDNRSDEKHKFFALRYSLQRMQWEEEEPIEYEVATDELIDDEWSGLAFDDFDPSIRALCVMKNAEPWQSPIIAVTIADGEGKPWTFRRYMNRNADGFDPGTSWATNNSTANAWRSLNGVILDFWSRTAPTGWHWTTVVNFFLIRYQIDENTWENRVVRYQNSNPDITTTRYVRVIQSTRLQQLMVSRDDEGSTTALLGFWWDSENLRVSGYDDAIFTHPGGDPDGDVSQVVLGQPRAQLVSINPDGRFALDLQVSALQEVYQDQWNRSFKLVNTVPGDPDPGDLNWGEPLIQLFTRFTQQPRIGKAGSVVDQAIQRITSEQLWTLNSNPNNRLVLPIAEAYYFVPMQIALQLHANGHYQAALDWFRSVYDYTLEPALRKISYWLKDDELQVLEPDRALDWLADPLNPHAIARTRPHTYTRYTIRAIVQCLLDYADAEFTMDTSESVPRARELYEDALALLNYLHGGHTCALTAALELLRTHNVPPVWVPAFTEALERLDPISTRSNFPQLVTNIGIAMAEGEPWGATLAAVMALVDAALIAVPEDTVTDHLDFADEVLARVTSGANGSLDADLALASVSAMARTTFDRAVSTVTGFPIADVEEESFPWFADDTATPTFTHAYPENPTAHGLSTALENYSREHPAQSFYVNDPLANVWLSGFPLSFCVVPNPVPSMLVLKAEVELFKIRNCMNIAGLVRELDPFSAPTDSTTGIQVIGAAGGTLNVPNGRPTLPSAYRYKTLVERARQLVGMAQQVEAAFLSTLEKLDAERYSELRAEQDVATSKATIKLQDLKVKEAESGVRLAELQKERAGLQASGLKGMIDEGLLASEQTMVASYILSGTLQVVLAALQQAQEATKIAVGVAAAGGGVTAPASVAAALTASIPGVAISAGMKVAQSAIIAANTTAQVASIYASFERRKQEWDFQLTLANKDVEIGSQQIKIAQDRVRIVGQEREIAVLQNDHAKATLDFLRNKFTSADLYEWMSGVLEDAYAWLLQEATAIAILAERQLAFERQLDLPPFVRSDYWVVEPNQLGDSLGGSPADRRGLTGSTRLLKDLTELDQYAFSTNSPKLQLSKTFSLSELAPEELAALRSTGLANFRTTHDHFDRDYPGHYLRLIKKVSVTVIALAPPSKGIRATLSNGGTSRVYVGGTVFQERMVPRYPEQIALSGGISDQGVFQLQREGEFLDPFEGSGVDTAWEFRMQKASNPFDFNSIADVLITIDYEALNNSIWGRIVSERLNAPFSAESALAVSMKNNLPDQWFDLHNPDQSSSPYNTTFTINTRDLVPHMREAEVSGVSLYVVMKDGAPEFNGAIILGSNGVISNVTPEANIITSGRFGTLLNGRPVATEWSFGLPPEAPSGRSHFDDQQVEDIFIVIRYTGITPNYMA